MELATSPAVSPLAAVTFDDVGRRFGSVQALDEVSFTVQAGETVALLGPNGAGKSTAIGLMLGLLRSTTGTVATFGADPAIAVAAGRVGAMLQSSGLPLGAQVRELIDFTRCLYPAPLDRATILDRAGLSALAARQTETLSGGEAQRLRFALAIAGDPELVFLDEPTVAMDVESRRAFWASMRRSAEEGRTILFATHYLEEADQVADRIVVLDHGRIVADGTAATIKAGVGGRTVRFTVQAADRQLLAALPAVGSVTIHGTDVTLATEDADATVRALVTTGVAFHDLEVATVDLERAFLALVGDDVAAG